MQANAIKLALMLRWGVGGDVTENGTAAESTADLGRDHERIGLALPDAELRDVALHIGFSEVGMIGIVELQTATGLQVVDPRQPVAVDERAPTEKSIDELISRI